MRQLSRFLRHSTNSQPLRLLKFCTRHEPRHVRRLSRWTNAANSPQHESRSMPDLSCADVNLRNTHPAPGIAVPTSPPNVPAFTNSVEIDQVGQPVRAVKTNELLGSKQSPKLSTSDGSLQSSPSAPALDESAPPTVVPASECGYYDFWAR
jgi:hypothetical protein